MGCECGSSRTRAILEFIAFLAVLAIGLLLILDNRINSSGLDTAAYLLSVYAAWRAGGAGAHHRRSPNGDGRDGG